MKNINDLNEIPKNCSLVLGFFDGIHLGHQSVVQNCKSDNKILVTFQASPAEYFNKSFNYIYSRDYNYKLLESYGLNYVYEQDFSEIVNISARDYLDFLLKKFKPNLIVTGFNHTFGYNRTGNPLFLKENSNGFDYKCVEPTTMDGIIVSSTKIKDFLSKGNLTDANKLLGRNFSIESSVIKGVQLGRKLGFPTANMKYPDKIIKVPYGVYLVKVDNMPAIMNFGIKPSFNAEETVEVHIPNFNGDLYGKTLRVEIISKIRNEMKFNSLEDLKKQIEKDIVECSRL